MRPLGFLLGSLLAATGCPGDDGNDGDDGDGGDTVAGTSAGPDTTTSAGTSEATGASGSSATDGDSTAAPMCEFVDVGPDGCPQGTVQCQPLGPSFNCAPVELSEACCEPCEPNECPG